MTSERFLCPLGKQIWQIKQQIDRTNVFAFLVMQLSLMNV